MRSERPDDRDAISAVHEAAFGRDAEARLVGAIRASPGFLPELSLVAERAAVIVGHALFSCVLLDDAACQHDALALGPIGVLPADQRQGVGSALVHAGLARAADAGHRLVVLLGHPTYYPRFGFVPSRAHGIFQPFDAGDAAMVLFLDPLARDVVRGTVRYPPAWEVVMHHEKE